MSVKFSVFFMGSSEICLPVLDLLRTHPLIHLKLIITPKANPAGRGLKPKNPATADYALEHKLDLLQTDDINQEQEFKQKFSKKVDLIIVFAFSHFIKKEVRQLARIGIYNIHTSLLPQYRGAAPIHYALLEGDKETGITIQEVAAQMDAGNIYVQAKLTIFPYENFGLLFARLKHAAVEALNQFLDLAFLSHQNSKPMPFTVQNHQAVSFAPLIKKDQGLIDFTSDSPDKIINKIRALGQNVGAYCFLQKKRLKIYQAVQIKLANKLKAGEIFFSSENLYFGTNQNYVAIQVYELQLEGKNRQLTVDFLKGQKEIPLFANQEKELP